MTDTPTGDEREAQRTAAVAELLKLGEDEAMSEYITIPERLTKRDQLGPSIRKLLVDEPPEACDACGRMTSSLSFRDPDSEVMLCDWCWFGDD